MSAGSSVIFQGYTNSGASPQQPLHPILHLAVALIPPLETGGVCLVSFMSLVSVRNRKLSPYFIPQ